MGFKSIIKLILIRNCKAFVWDLALNTRCLTSIFFLYFVSFRFKNEIIIFVLYQSAQLCAKNELER